MTLPTDMREEINGLIRAQLDAATLAARLTTVRKLALKAGEVLQVRVGGALGDDMPPWVPTQDDLEFARQDWERVLPPGVKLIVTHHMMDPEVVRSDG